MEDSNKWSAAWERLIHAVRMIWVSFFDFGGGAKTVLQKGGLIENTHPFTRLDHIAVRINLCTARRSTCQSHKSCEAVDSRLGSLPPLDPGFR